MTRKNSILTGVTLLLAGMVLGAYTFFLTNPAPAPQVACTQEAMICPDGTAVGRTGPNCTFPACPSSGTPSSTVAEGKFCGGIAAFACPSGYSCKFDGTFPDAGGHCTLAGTLTGKVSVGPICPVERVGVPCPVPPEAYTSRSVLIYDKSGTALVTQSNFNPDGTYRFELPPGQYVVKTSGSGGVGGSRDLPKTVTINAQKTTTLDFSIDTGIR